MKYLITGASGFVGKHLVSHLSGTSHSVLATYHTHAPRGQDTSTIEWVFLNLSNPLTAEFKDALFSFKPDAVIHLGSKSNIVESFKEPCAYFKVNVCGTLALFEILKTLPSPPLFLFISTGNIFNANTFNTKEPALISELTLPCFDNVYALSKHTIEKALPLVYPRYCIARPFNHSGAGQSDAFVLPSFCKQVALMAKKQMPAVLYVGNLSVFKNFLHVDDVISAYLTILAKGTQSDTYHIASRETLTLEEIVLKLKTLSHIDFEIRQEKERMRNHETYQKVDICTHKLSALGWHPSKTIDQLLQELYTYYLTQ